MGGWPGAIELKDCLISIEKGQLIYELSDKETVYIAVSNFIGEHLVRDSCLTWKELEELLIGDYVVEVTAIEAMRRLMKLVQLKDETPGELGVRAEKLGTLAFTEEGRNSAVMQAQLVNLYVEVLWNERIHHNVIKEAPVKLSTTVALAKDNQGIWEKVKENKAQEWSREVGRWEGREKKPHIE